MSKYEKLLIKLLSGTYDSNVSFKDLCWLLMQLGFDERIKGSHHIYTRDGVEEIINIQSKGNKAKPYQVKQVRKIIVKYKLGSISFE